MLHCRHAAVTSWISASVLPESGVPWITARNCRRAASNGSMAFAAAAADDTGVAAVCAMVARWDDAMTAKIIPYDEAAQTLERDRKAFRMRLAGLSVRRIAEELQVSIDRVEASLSRMIGGITPDMRRRALELELERLDEFQRAHYSKALKGDVESTAISLRIMERRARLLGIDSLPQPHGWREDDLPGAVPTTERIQRALDLIAGKGPLLEGEIAEED